MSPKNSKNNVNSASPIMFPLRSVHVRIKWTFHRSVPWVASHDQKNCWKIGQ